MIETRLVALDKEYQVKTGARGITHDGLYLYKTYGVHPDYGIAHVASGLIFWRSYEVEQMRDKFRRLCKVRIGSKTLGELPGCEVLANALLVKQQVEETTTDERLLENAAIIGNILACTKEG